MGVVDILLVLFRWPKLAQINPKYKIKLGRREDLANGRIFIGLECSQSKRWNLSARTGVPEIPRGLIELHPGGRISEKVPGVGGLEQF